MDKLQAIITSLLERMPDFNAQAVLFALIAGWITGWVWYLIADGAYRSATKGMDGEKRAPRTQIRAAIAQVVMTVMLAIIIQKFGAGTLQQGVSIAIMLWFGFVMTTMMVNHSHLGAPLSLTIVDGIHWFLVLVVMGAIIGTLATGPADNRATPATAPPAASSSPATPEPPSARAPKAATEASTGSAEN